MRALSGVQRIINDELLKVIKIFTFPFVNICRNDKTFLPYSKFLSAPLAVSPMLRLRLMYRKVAKLFKRESIIASSPVNLLFVPNEKIKRQNFLLMTSTKSIFLIFDIASFFNKI